MNIHKYSPHKNRGFTIIELVIVITLFIILTAIALPDIFVWMSGYRLTGAVRMVRSNLYNAKILAVKNGLQYRLVVESDSFSFEQGDKSSGSGNWTTVESHTFADYPGVTAHASANPIFNPRGTVSPSSTISLTNDQGVTTDITVSISGRIMVK